MKQVLLKFGSQPLSYVEKRKLVKFEERIGKLIDEILLIPWVKKRFNFHIFFISRKTKKYNLIFVLLKSSYYHRFLTNWFFRHLEYACLAKSIFLYHQSHDNVFESSKFQSAYTNLHYFVLLTYSCLQNSRSYYLSIIVCLKGKSFLFLRC